jgi:hypothetical protein
MPQKKNNGNNYTIKEIWIESLTILIILEIVSPHNGCSTHKWAIFDGDLVKN